MAYEKTEPKNNQIFFWGIVSMLTLGALVPLFHTYFNSMYGQEQGDKVTATDADEDGVVDYIAAKDAFLQDRQAALAAANIDQAMNQLAERGRNLPAVRPRRNDGLDVPEEDALSTLAAERGWDGLPREAEEERAANALRERREREEAARDAARQAALEAAQGEGEGSVTGNLQEVIQQIRQRVARPEQR